MRWNPLRITNAWIKVAYIAAWWVGGVLLVNVAFGWAPQWVSAPIGTLWDVTAIILGTRVFRVAGEPVVPPRPIWQATGRPRASFVIGTLSAVGLLFCLIGVATTPEFAVGYANPAVLYAAAAVFYLQSGVRLRRDPRAVPDARAELTAPLPKPKRLDLR